ncbi:MAG: hypothetical protein ACU88J_08690 [Gammaproteobacteria bacterium]
MAVPALHLSDQCKAAPGKFVPDPLVREENPGFMDRFELAIHSTGHPLSGEYDDLEHKSDKV